MHRPLDEVHHRTIKLLIRLLGILLLDSSTTIQTVTWNTSDPLHLARAIGSSWRLICSPPDDRHMHRNIFFAKKTGSPQDSGPHIHTLTKVPSRRLMTVDEPRSVQPDAWIHRIRHEKQRVPRTDSILPINEPPAPPQKEGSPLRHEASNKTVEAQGFVLDICWMKEWNPEGLGPVGLNFFFRLLCVL